MKVMKIKGLVGLDKSIGLIHDMPTVQELIERMVKEAMEIRK